MRKNQCFALALAGLLLSAASVSSPAAGPLAVIGKPVPDFSLTDVQGKSHTLSSFRGKVVVLEWTNPDCPFVQRVYKEGIMPAVQRRAAREGVVWLTLNSTNPSSGGRTKPEEQARIYGEWKAASAAILMDPTGGAGRAFGAKTTPHMFVIGKDGALLYSGAIDDDARGEMQKKTNYVETALDQVQGGKPVATSVTTPYGCSVKY